MEVLPVTAPGSRSVMPAGALGLAVATVTVLAPEAGTYPDPSHDPILGSPVPVVRAGCPYYGPVREVACR